MINKQLENISVTCICLLVNCFPERTTANGRIATIRQMREKSFAKHIISEDVHSKNEPKLPSRFMP